MLSLVPFPGIMTTHVHFDCFSGCAGDMMTACLLGTFPDPPSTLARLVENLKRCIPEIADEFNSSIKKVMKSDGGIQAWYVDVESVYDHRAEVVPKDLPKDDHSHGHSHDHSHGHSHGHSHAHDGHSDDQSHDHSHHRGHSHDHGQSHDQHTSDHSDDHSHDHGHSHDHSGPSRNLPIIRAMLEKSTLPQKITSAAISAFTHLARAESHTHGTSSIDTVYFHEVGAIDSIVDTLSVLILLFDPDFIGADSISCSRLPLGVGTVQTAHGELPVPAPATLRLMQTFVTCGGPRNSKGWSGELVTPTAVSLLRALIPEESGWRGAEVPPFQLKNVGLGAGKKDFREFANIMRCMVGTIGAPNSFRSENQLSPTPQYFVTAPIVTESAPVASSSPASSGAVVTETLSLLSANVDDTTPEIVAFALDKFLDHAGALDAWSTPIVMKKSRPALTVSVLTKPSKVESALNVFFTELTTLGVRVQQIQRSSIEREFQSVQTKFGEIKIKVGYINSEIVNVKPEFEDCKRAAESHNAPLKIVMEAARLSFFCSDENKK